MQSVSDWEGRVNDIARTALMSPILYNGRKIKAFIMHGDQSQSWGGVQGQSQDITLDVLKTDVGIVASGVNGDTVYLPKLKETFYIRNKSESMMECGNFWMLTLQRKR